MRRFLGCAILAGVVALFALAIGAAESGALAVWLLTTVGLALVMPDQPRIVPLDKALREHREATRPPLPPAKDE